MAFATATQARAAIARPVFGRQDECDRLVAWLRGRTPIVTVWGGPGLRKSRLVIETIRRLATEPGSLGRRHADLRGAHTDDIVRVVAGAAGSLDSSDSPEEALGRALGKLGRVLLVADTVEHVATLVATLAVTFVRVSPRVQVLAASRRRWCPPGAVTLEVGPLSTVAAPGRPSAAAALLLDRIDGGSDATQAERAERLAGALEGIPLAIELAATSVPVLGLDGVLARVSRNAEAGGGPPAMQAPMRRILESAWQGLGDDEREALAQCAVFHGGFTVDAAEAVVKTSNAGATVLGLVQALRDNALLRSWTLGSSGEVRLSMFAAVHEFAWEKLRERPERSEERRAGKECRIG
jgi:predicted ATPase